MQEKNEVDLWVWIILHTISRLH